MATAERELSNEAFMQEVTQRGLDVKGPSGWYLFAGYQGPRGWEVIKTDARDTTWIYQARRVATQANAAGGAIKIDISVASGQIARLICAYVANSGTNDMTILLLDEDAANACVLGTVASGAARTANLPTIGLSVTNANFATSEGFIIPSGAMLSFGQTGAGAQNDTMTVYICLELFNNSTIPTWSKARSTNEANVTLAASTISTANEITPGRLWI